MKINPVDKSHKKHLRQVMIEEILYLNSQGYNNQDIATVFNMTRSGIKKILDTSKSKGAMT